MKKLIVIVGPNASGKSELAVRLAKKFSARGGSAFGGNGAEIISADSRQVYKGLDIGSGKITKKEMQGIPHHLLDIASPKRIFTVAQYQKLALKAIKNIWQREKLPIICGGTGFYVQAVVDGLIIPEIKPDLKLRKKLEKKSTEELFNLLKRKDQRRAKEIDRHNKRRLIRALEIVEAIGRVPKLKTEPLRAEISIIGIKKSRSALKKLIHRRLIKRLKMGLLKEVGKLHRQGLSWQRLENFGLEYRFGAQLLQGKLTEKEFIAKLENAIYQYAKRQMTWFKRDKRIKWLENKNQAENQTEKLVLNFLSK